MNKYHYIIIGGGPCGLALAQLLSKSNKSILLLESENSLGGCHRVARVGKNNQITEHSPRIYSTSYKNLETLLKDMNLDFHSLFVKYKFSISEIGNKNIRNLRPSELFALIFSFLKMTANNEYGSDISMKQYMIDRKFSEESKSYIDRVCRVIDGASSDKFSLNEFLQVANQQSLYPLYQPRLPMDIGLIKYWSDYLQKKRVEIKLNSALTKILPDENKILVNNSDEYVYNKLIIATNPYNIFKIAPRIFPSITPQYATRTRYMTYLSMTFYWSYDIKLPVIHGFSSSEWGVLFIVMSDYFENMKGKETLVSLGISILNNKSLVLDKTANQISDFDIIKKEVFRQFLTSFPSNTNIPFPESIEFYPGTTYVGNPPNGGWTSKGGSFFNSFDNNNTYIPFESSIYPNIYNLGCQNGYQTYKFTAIESAITNSIHLAKRFEPELLKNVKLKTGITLISIIYVGLFIQIVLFSMYMWKKWPLRLNIFLFIIFISVVMYYFKDKFKINLI